jgi:hypothetical protein
MTFSYDAGLEEDGYWVRFRLGDTDSTDYYLEDESIDAMLTSFPNKYLAGAACADAIVAKLAREPTRKVGDLQINNTDTIKYYSSVSSQLRKESLINGSIAPIYFGGVFDTEVDDHIANEIEDGYIAPKFYKGRKH